MPRNATEYRSNHKALKRNPDFSTNFILIEDKNYRLVSNEGEIHLRIDNSELGPDEVAELIKERFKL